MENKITIDSCVFVSALNSQEEHSNVDIDYHRTIDMSEFVTENNLRGMDAVVVWVAKEFVCDLATFDKEIKNLIKKDIRFVDL